MTPRTFVGKLALVRLPCVFNPYSQVDRAIDSVAADRMRRRNLVAYLEEACDSGSDLWVARDLGYRGGRRTGIPLTDEAHLENLEAKLNRSFRKATLGPVVAERTARVVWRLAMRLRRLPVFWNLFPLHPYVRGNFSSNRAHSVGERTRCSEFVRDIVAIVKPKRVIAIGGDAAIGLARLGYRVTAVRHPSYGGQTEFETQILRLYRLSGEK